MNLYFSRFIEDLHNNQLDIINIDGEIYIAPKNECDEVNSAMGDCCGCCCEETLKDLTEAIRKFKERNGEQYVRYLWPVVSPAISSSNEEPQ